MYKFVYNSQKWLLPTVDFLKECHRVLKDGAFFVTTFSPRQDLQCVFSYRLLEAGFDINFTPILWCFASGFPKAMDFGKFADKKFNAEREIIGYSRQGAKSIFDGGGKRKVTLPAKYLDGLKSCQLKPAYEVVIIAQKPHKAKSKIDQALVWYNERKELLDKGIKEEDLYLYTKNASGGVRIDKNDMFEGAMSSRIPIENMKNEPGYRPNRVNHNTLKGKTSIINIGGNNFNLPDLGTHSSEGRFPATILTGSPIDFDGQDILELHTTQTTSPILFALLDYIGLTLDDFKALSTEELQGIIAKLKKLLDVGRETKSVGGSQIKRQTKEGYSSHFGQGSSRGEIHSPENGFQDQGDLSRYFSLDAWTKKNLPELYKISKKTLELQEDVEKISPFLFTSKADKGSKNAGLQGVPLGEAPASARSKPAEGRQNALGEPRQNTHPTSKSLALYSYLVNLFTHPHDLVLDPYCGSGTTPIACLLTARKYIGLELEKEYSDIAVARVKHWEEQLNLQKQRPTSIQPPLENADLFKNYV